MHSVLVRTVVCWWRLHTEAASVRVRLYDERTGGTYVPGNIGYTADGTVWYGMMSRQLRPCRHRRADNHQNNSLAHFRIAHFRIAPL